MNIEYLFERIERWVSHFRSLFLNPRENGAEIVLSLAIIVVGAAILWVAASIAWRGLGELVRRARANPRYVLGALPYAGAVVLAAIWFGSVSFVVTANSSFCGKSCHSMNPSFQSWRRSAHSEVACVSCHARGVIGSRVISPVVQAVKHIDEERTGRYSRVIRAVGRAGVADGVCLGCHRAKRPISGSDALTMYHRAHTDPTIRCVTCHNRSAHPKAERYEPLRSAVPDFKYKDYMSVKQGCGRCHRRARMPSR